VADAGEAVRNGRDVLEWEIREYPGPLGDDNVIRGDATVDLPGVGPGSGGAVHGRRVTVSPYTIAYSAVAEPYNLRPTM
jgi:hypothetical protein